MRPDLAVLFPFHLPIPVPSALVIWTKRVLLRLRITPSSHGVNKAKHTTSFTKLLFPMNFMTAPLVADLFLLAILAIGRDEVYNGTIGANNINPIDIMAFFLTLAYIAISIDASGLIRYLAFRVLTWGGKVGHRLFFYLYAFFFALGSFIGNDPIILSGTAFLAYMTRVSSNIEHPRAWIHTQFAVANIASAILVSSNPTNLVLAGAFDVKFVNYTANMIVPVVITAIVTFPFLLYIIFAHERLIPITITMHELPEEYKGKAPVNPNIPNARGDVGEWDDQGGSNERGKIHSLEEIMNPFIDRSGAAFGASIMTATLVTVLALNAASQSTGEHPVFWVTLPAATIMFCWDIGSNWIGRHKTRQIARDGRRAIEEARRRYQAEHASNESTTQDDQELSDQGSRTSAVFIKDVVQHEKSRNNAVDGIAMVEIPSTTGSQDLVRSGPDSGRAVTIANDRHATTLHKDHGMHLGRYIEPALDGGAPEHSHEPPSLVSMVEDAYYWCQETFPTVTAVLEHLPFALVPFAFCMFVLVEALVTKGWVPVFAYGWDHWVTKTGTVGAVGGMAFLSVILCNVSASR